MSSFRFRTFQHARLTWQTSEVEFLIPTHCVMIHCCKCWWLAFHLAEEGEGLFKEFEAEPESEEEVVLWIICHTMGSVLPPPWPWKLSFRRVMIWLTLRGFSFVGRNQQISTHFSMLPSSQKQTNISKWTYLAHRPSLLAHNCSRSPSNELEFVTLLFLSYFSSNNI